MSDKDKAEKIVNFVNDTLEKSVAIMQHQQSRIDQLEICVRRMEEKLLKYISKEEYIEFSKDIAKEMFFNEVTNMPDSPFKDFCIDNFQDITSTDGIDFSSLLGGDDDNNDI